MHRNIRRLFATTLTMILMLNLLQITIFAADSVAVAKSAPAPEIQSGVPGCKVNASFGNSTKDENHENRVQVENAFKNIDTSVLVYYTVTFSVPSGIPEPDSMICSSNGLIQLPIVAAPQGYTFLGWVETDYNNASDRPAGILTGTYSATRDICLRALYAFATGDPIETVFIRVTEDSVNWSGRYLIIGKNSSNYYYAMKGLGNIQSYQTISNGGAVLLTNTGMTQNGNTMRNATDQYIFEITPAPYGYTIKNTSSNTYVGIRGNNLYALTDNNEDYNNWTFTINTSGNVLSHITNGEAFSYIKFSSVRFEAYSNTNNVFFWRETTTGYVYTTVIGELAHQHSVIHYDGQPATCTSDGLMPYYSCAAPSCEYYGRMFIDEDLSVEIIDAVLPMLGHAYGEWVETSAPTCLEVGIETRTCSRCEETEIRETAALGHDWDNGEVTVEPTEEESGVRTYTCRRCSETRTEVIPNLAFRFDDVKDPGMYYYEPVYWAFFHNPQITTGTSATMFSPEKSCTRAHVVTFLWRAMGSPEPAITEHSFTDVESSAYYYKAMLWAIGEGITSGTSSTTFSPNKKATRAQVMTFLWRAMGSPSYAGTANSFADVQESAYYYNAVMWATGEGITIGISSTAFGPNKEATRAQVVTFLFRTFCKNPAAP